MRRALFVTAMIVVSLLASVVWYGCDTADSGPGPGMTAWTRDHVRTMAPTIRAQGYICDAVSGARALETREHMALYRITCTPGARVSRHRELLGAAGGQALVRIGGSLTAAMGRHKVRSGAH